MSYLFDAAGEHIRGTFGSTQTAYPMTLACWVKKTNWDAGWAYPFDFGTDFVSQNYSHSIQNAFTADNISASSRTTGADSASYAFAAEAYDATWVAVVGVFTGAADRDIYINSISETANNTNTRVLNNTLDSVSIGTNVTDANMWDGLVAECAIWTAALSSADITSFLGGTDPSTINNANQIGYWSLDTDQASHTDESGQGGPTLSVTNATFSSDHPTIGASGNPWNYYAQQ